MSLFPKYDIIRKEIESWSGFSDSLQTEEDRKLFKKMLNECYEYSVAINSKGEPFPPEALFMALLLSQQKMIDWLISQTSRERKK
ncbi:MAG TPA: hypothetical protein VE089_02045 [Nitrososphaeraceae archaeon]|nr:hypothetical protein [Nitrososphaeraceae archaeon]